MSRLVSDGPGPEAGSIPWHVPVRAVLLETVAITVVADAFRVWPTGLCFSLTASLSDTAVADGEIVELLADGMRPKSGNIWEAPGATFPLTLTVGDDQPMLPGLVVDQPHDAEGLWSQMGNGYNNTWEEHYWMRPTPSADVLLTVNWPERMLSGSATIKVADLVRPPPV